MSQKLDSRYIALLARIRSKIALSQFALWAEGLTRSFWPLMTFALFVYAFAAFRGFDLIPLHWTKYVMGAIVLIALVLFGLGIRRFRLPTTMAALNRLDQGISEHPLTSLRDKTAVGRDDPLTRALWDRHQARMVEKTLAAKAAPPDLRLASRDRYGLRLMALLLGFLAITFAPRDFVNSVRNSIAADAQADVASLSYEAWANPPVYTGRPSLYLLEVDSDETLSLPRGTELIFRVYGLGGQISVSESVSGVAEIEEATTEGLYASQFLISQSGRVELREDGEALATWQFTVEEDTPPVVTVAGRLQNDGTGLLELPFDASDDFGVSSGTATIRLDLANVDRRHGLAADPVELDPIVIDLPMPFSGDTTEISEVLRDDLSEHMWNGLPVTVELTVVDEIGQTGTVIHSGDDLPGLRFYNPLAAAIAEMRRDILWSPDNHHKVLQVLRAITYLPEDYRLSASTYLNVRTIIRRYDAMLEDGLSAEEQKDITDYMWLVAQILEQGDVQSARERLQRAQERLSQAIQDGADPAEIDQLMEELRDATNEYLQALADEAIQNGDQQQAQQSEPGEAMELTMQDIQEMMDRIQELTENGQMAEAQELLNQMMELLQNLQMAENQSPGQGQGAQQLQEMQDALNQQQGLSDDTFDNLQDQASPGDDQQPPDAQDGSDPQTNQELAERQEALRELLEDMQQGGAAEESLEEAERNMRDAREALEEGDLGRALDEQAEAMESLREGMRELTEEMQRAEADGTGQQQETENDSDEVDPLGRPLGEDGRSTTSENLLPEQDAMDRARELLDEIRRRSGETDRPQVERDYLERLLENF